MAELTRTSRSGFEDEQANPPASAKDALGALCTTILEPIRAKFGPVSVHSGYRSPALNAATPGASKTSQHSLGQACDLHCPNATLQEVFDWIRFDSKLPFGQVILEGHDAGHPTWVHVSLGKPYRAGTCGEVLVCYAGHYSVAPAGRLS